MEDYAASFMGIGIVAGCAVGFSRLPITYKSAGRNTRAVNMQQVTPTVKKVAGPNGTVPCPHCSYGAR